MNRKKLLIITAAALITVNLTGCSIFKSKNNHQAVNNKPTAASTEQSNTSGTSTNNLENNNTSTEQSTETTSSTDDNSTNSSTVSPSNSSTSKTSTKSGSSNTSSSVSNGSSQSGNTGNDSSNAISKPGNSDNDNTNVGSKPGNSDNGNTNAGSKPGNSDNSNNNGGSKPGNSDNSNNNGGSKPGNSDNGNNNGGSKPGNSDNGNNNGGSQNGGNNGGTGNSGDTDTEVDDQWSLVWHDEFSGKTLDTSKWNYDIGNAIVDANGNKVADGWGNNEKEYYTNSTNNVYLENGQLMIKANKENITDQFGTVLNYTSGKIKTLGKFSKKYGKIEVNAKLPQGKGFWPAIWMLPEKDVYGGWASSGEIDMMEAWGSKPDRVAGTIHYGGTWPNNTYSGKEYSFPASKTISNDFHTYSLEWEPGEIRWYVDGNLYQTQNNWFTKGANNQEKYSFPAPFDQNFYLILNLAVGGNWDGEPDDSTQFSQPMEIDYVRMYDLTGREYKTPVDPVVAAEPLPTDAKAATADGNYIYNGDFNKNEIQQNADGSLPFGTGWNFVHIPDAGGNGSTSIDTINGTNYAKVNITSAGSQNYSVQLIQLATLGKGRYYKLSYDAKTDTSTQIGVKMSAGASRGWTSYTETYAAELTSDMKHFEKTFQMQKDSDSEARLEFELGLNTNPVWIGNVRLEEVPAPAVDYNATKAPLSDGNRIYNGAFDKGNVDRMTYWNFSASNAQATAAVPEATREMTVNIQNGGTDSDAVSLNQKGIQLLKDNDYKLTFKARAELPRTIKVGFLNKDGSVIYADDSTVNLTSSMTEQTVNFTMQQPTDIESQVVFKLGGSDSDVYIDDVSLIQTSNAIDYSQVDLYPLKNGDFTKGLDSWKPYPNIGDGGDSTITSENSEAKISINNVGPNPWSILLNQENLKLSKGIEYVIGFDVRATAARNMELVIENSAYTRYLSKTVEAPATSEMKHYEYTLKLDKDDTVNLKLLMGKTDANVPASQHDIYIDNVKCEVKDAKFISSIAKNGTFTDTLDPWTIWTGDGGAADVSLTNDGVMKISVQNAGPNSWSVQALQENLKFEKGQKYSVSFKAKADESRKMNVNIGKALSADPWYTAFADTQIVDLTDTMKDYTFDFTMNQDTYDNGKMVFELGNVTGGNAATNVYIDDVAINKVAADSDTTPTTPPVTTEGYSLKTNSSNILQNGDFDTDTTAWDSWWGDQWSGLSSGTVKAENGKVKIHLESIGGASYSPQVFQHGFKLETGKTYVVSFKAKADIARKLNVNIGKALSTDPWFTAYIPTKTVDIATTEQKYTYAFKVTEATESDLKIVFEAGNIAGGNAITDIYLDDITIQEVTSGTAPTGLIVTNSTDVVQNGTFSTDTESWDSWWGDQWSGLSTGDVTVDNGKLKVHLTSIGGATYSPQVFQQGLKLENGKTYVVNFKAKADAARKLNVNIGKTLSADPWFTSYTPTKTMDIATTEQQYTYTFKVTEATDSNLKIVFELGNVTGGNAITDIYLDDISIQESNSN